MPIYEFKCCNCGKIFEKLIFSKQEEKSIKCPYCNSQKIEKILAGFSSVKTGSNISCRNSKFT